MTYPEVEAFETFFKSLTDHLHAHLSDAYPEFAVLQLANFFCLLFFFPHFALLKGETRLLS